MDTSMIDDAEPVGDTAENGLRRPARSLWKIVFVGLVVLLAAVVLAGWFSRERIADNLISGELERLGLPATYRIVSIGTRRQEIADLVVGDPERPDFTARRVIVGLTPRLGLPDISSVRLVEPRLYGRLVDGKVSFGSLDPLIYTGSDEPFSLPDLDLAVEDGRALVESEYGAVGVKMEGAGQLRGGFEGVVAAIAPELDVDGCKAVKATLYGRIAVVAREPRFKGPVRLGSLDCEDNGVQAGSANVLLDANLREDLQAGEIKASLTAEALGIPAARLARAMGDLRVSVKDERVTARFDLAGNALATSQLEVNRVSLDGTVRALRGGNRIDVEADFGGQGATLGKGLQESLAGLRSGSDGTLVGDITDAVQQALSREVNGASLSGHFVARRSAEGTSMVVPRAVAKGRSGAALLSLSRFQLDLSGSVPRVRGGNFATGGRGLPRMSGRVRAGTGGGNVLELRMAEYEAERSRIAVPRLMVVQSPGGEVGFAGQANLEGPLPGGFARNLTLPLDGNWSARRGLSLWRKCTSFGFDRIELAQLELAKRDLVVCPPRGGAIVRSGPDGMRIAGGLAPIDLQGQLADTPIRISGKAAGFAWPGNLDARDLEVALGPEGARSTFGIARLAGTLSDSLGGSFSGASVKLDAVPLDLYDVAGDWRYVNGRLELSNGTLRVEDREQVDRFEPLIARDAGLTLADSVIEAAALFREPESDREVVKTLIRHHLSTGEGSADLMVDGIVFDEELQPDTLTNLALGVIANARGVVTGKGRIAWDQGGISSTGRFATDNLDFAAAFGPVTGASGSITFTDLLGLETAPGQVLKLQAINPGVEVTDGRVTYRLDPGNILTVSGGTWPFMGGTLRLEPVALELGSDAPMRYVLTIEGLDAALFLQRLELGNLSATGTFDGKLPLLFDKDGGHIEGGYLDSRPPGGNVSYVGELTYEDLSAMANFAFDALRSIDYRQMRIDMDGELDGEIITRVAFEGISQGEGATSNFLTRRIAKLPIRFRVNVRAPFMQLITSVRSIYDPEYIRDPRTLGLDLADPSNGNRTPEPPAEPESPSRPALRPPEPTIQPSESDQMP